MLRTLMTRALGFIKEHVPMSNTNLEYKSSLNRQHTTPLLKSYRIDELFMQHNSKEGFCRLDIIVRVLAIENEMGYNDYGWDLYRKMQTQRLHEDIDQIDERVLRFREAISEPDRILAIPILLDSELRLYDGSHRIALAIYYKHNEIECAVNPALQTNTYYGYNWFQENGFSDNEIGVICSRTRELVDRFVIQIPLLLWPPVEPFFGDILEMIRGQGYDVDSVVDKDFSENTFETMVRDVYNADDISQERINKKLEYLRKYDSKCVRYINLRFKHPRYRIKELTGNLILMQGEAIKTAIRNEYMNKIVYYYFDIICHSADNMYQADVIRQLFENIK